MRPCAFAIPGDHRQKTGGYIYERRLLEELQASGRDTRHIALPAAAASPDQPDAQRAEVAKTLSRLDLSPEHEERLATMTKALVKKLLHQPTKILRDRKDEAFTQNARELFGLDEE